MNTVLSFIKSREPEYTRLSGPRLIGSQIMPNDFEEQKKELKRKAKNKKAVEVLKARKADELRKTNKYLQSERQRVARQSFSGPQRVMLFDQVLDFFGI